MPIAITSKNNIIYKKLKKLSKSKNNFVFIEGKKLFQEAINSPIIIEKIYLDEENNLIFSKLLPHHEQDKIIFMKNELIASLFTTENKPGSDDLVLAVAKRPVYNLNDLFKSKKTLLLFEQVQDPGNLGTIIRSALAFNCGGVILSDNSTDPFSTKVLRASAGAVFSLPVIKINHIESVIEQAKKEKYTIIATSKNTHKLISDINLKQIGLFLFGNEGRGLSKELLNLSDEVIMIPHSSSVESLNLATSVSIVLWEMYKIYGKNLIN